MEGKILKTVRFLNILLIYFVTFILVIPDAQANDTLYGKVLKEIRITGARRTDVDIITRELASQIGEPYLKINADKDYARLDKLDIFSYVKIQPAEAEAGVVLEIEVQEIFPYLPFFSYEVTDENGFSAGAGFQSVNMLRRDIFFTGFARFGGATNFGILLENPWIAGNHLSYTFEFFQRQRFTKLDQFMRPPLNLI